MLATRYFFSNKVFSNVFFLGVVTSRGRLVKWLTLRLPDWLFGVKCRFQHYLSSIAMASAPTHAYIEFFSFDKYPAQYSFQATGCFPT